MRMNMNTKPARRVSAVLIAAIVFVLAASIAVAATIQSRILDGLFVYDDPSEAAQEAVIHGGDSATDEGITLAVTEYLMDSNMLHVAWNVTSERDEPVYYVTGYDFNDGGAAESQPVGGNYGGYSSGEVGDNMLVQLTPENPVYSGKMGNGYRSAPDVPVEATVWIRVFTSDLTPVAVEEWDRIYHPTGADGDAYQAMAVNGEIGVSPEGWCNLDEYPAYRDAYAVLMEGYDRESDPDSSLWNRLCEDALVESGLMQPLTELSVTVSIPVQTSDPAKSAGISETEFSLPDRRVVIHEFSMDVASTVLRYDVYPTVDVDLDDSWPYGWWYLLVDPDGNVMNVAIGLGMDMSANGDEYEAGEPLCMKVECLGNPAVEIPEYVTFVPTCVLERGENESSFDYYQRMAVLADPEDCFTVYLTDGK